MINKSRAGLVLIILVAVFALSVVFFSKLIPRISASSKASAWVPPVTEKLDSPSEPAKIGLPVRLIIPKLEVDAKVEYVALAKDKTMDVPKNQANVAWYLLGNRPGEVGTAVISGHYGWRDDKPLVFAKLSKLR
ncbi:MAG: class F sortase, partial [bacterium]|nr:class F sortase [bacterium]